MIHVLRATAALGTSSVVTILVGLVSAKAFALLIGPSGIGYMGLLLSTTGIFGLVAGMGLGSGFIRLAGNPIAKGDWGRVWALRTSAWLLFWVFAGPAAMAMILFRIPIAATFLGDAGAEDAVVWMSIALVLSLGAGLQTSVLNAHHRIGALAKAGIWTAVLGTGAAIGIVASRGYAGIPIAVTVQFLVGWMVVTLYVRRATFIPVASREWRRVLEAAKSLLAFGGPFTLSMLAGQGVQLAMPIVVLQLLDQESVGYYRVVVTVSVAYLGIVLTAMSKDYFPRLSASITDLEVLNRTANDQHRLALLLGGPLIVAMIVLAPVLVPLVYSDEFVPAVDVLRWHLVGDVLKFSGWAMAYLLLVRAGSGVFLVAELSGGITRLISTFLAASAFGLDGLGIANILTYVVYGAVVYGLARRSTGFQLSVDNVVVLVIQLMLVSAAMFVAQTMESPQQIAAQSLVVGVSIVFSLVSLHTWYRSESASPERAG